MSDKIKKLVNVVRLTGKIAEIEVKAGVTKKGAIPYVSIKGAIQFGATKTETRRFETYQQFANAETGKESKLYDPTVKFGKEAKSIAKVGFDDATLVEIQGDFEANDYVNQKDMLVEGLNVKATFFNDVEPTAKLKGTIDIEGYIQSIIEEIKGEDAKETGRLRVTLLSTNFFGDIVAVKNIIVPESLKEGFLSTYEVGQTAVLFLDFVTNKGDAKPKVSGGLGVQRETEGKSYVEMVVTGANPPVDADEDFGISTEAIRIALSERKVKLDELKEKGYQGKKTAGATTNRVGLATSKAKVVSVDDEDIPF